MNEYAIQAEGLTKRYRIGKLQNNPQGGSRVRQFLSKPFQYLARSLREPDEDEILWAIRDVSFEVAHGDVLGLIGRNGAGKSTLLKVLSRITEPTSGRATIHGRVGSLLEVGTGFHPELTGRENIYLSGAILGMYRTELDRKFDEIVEFAGVERFLDTQVKRYSSGMYVRLAFAVAAHLDPEILLIDEVLAVGDAAFQKKCLGKMGDVATEGRTVLFVSHNMVAIQNLCPQVLWIDEGEIRQHGASDQVISSYLENAASNQLERLWPERKNAPGNEKVRIHSLSIEPVDSRDPQAITMDSPLRITVKYWNLEDGTRMLIGLRFFTDRQEVAFTTVSDETIAGFDGKVHQTGLFQSECFIPANLLNEGGYRITLYVYQDRGKVHYRMDDALTFEVRNNGKRPGYRYGREPGVVRPLLEWRTSRVHDDLEEA